MDDPSHLVQRQTEFAAQFRISYDEYKKLVTTLSLEEITTCLELLRCKQHRSGFRRSMEVHIREWLAGNKYLKPLHPHQFKLAKPKWPVKFTLPT